MSFYSRKPTRIPGYDYSTQNYYFITICTHNKEMLFGKPRELNACGKIASEYIQKIERIFCGVRVDNFIIMPNHVHAIIAMEEVKEKQTSLSTVIGQYKSAVTKRIHEVFPKMKVWQRSFHDHIIRNQADYERIWEYVEYNDAKWQSDCFYCK